MNKILKRLISGLSAAVISVANLMPVAAVETGTDPAADPTEYTSVYPTEFTTEEPAEELTDAPYEDVTEPELLYRNIEAFPLGEEAGNTVTLDGLMPEDALLTAVDVSCDFTDPNELRPDEPDSEQPSEIRAAYDITIQSSDGEFQPVEDNPILVEITDPAIAGNGTTELWHIIPDGENEQITDFYAENGKVSFYASGFSVYVIVEAPEGLEQRLASSVDNLTGEDSEFGFRLLYGSNNYITDQINAEGALIETTSVNSGADWFFDTYNGHYRIYTLDENGDPLYIHTQSGVKIELSSAQFDLFDITSGAVADSFYLKKTGSNNYLQHSRSGNGLRYYGSNDNATNCSIKAVYVSSVVMPDDYYELDGKSYGIMRYVGGTYGNTMTTDTAKINNTGNDRVGYLDINATLTRPDPITHEGINFVSTDIDVTLWTFHNVEKDIYTMSAETADGTKYLQLTSSGLYMTDEANASPIKVIPDPATGKVRLASGNYSVSYEVDSNKNPTGFKTATGTPDKVWLNLVEPTDLTNDDFVTYSAEKVAITEPESGKQVIIYTRIWNNDTKSYEYYAVDHDGTLVPCFERSDYIMWVGTKVNSLLWNFTEYFYDNGESTNYYELYNPYSGKYIAPQLLNSQILSDNTIGINLPGRSKGEYYSEIHAWDDDYYAFSGVVADIASGQINSGTKYAADTFYFAIMEEISSDSLTPIDTVDNNDFGITMRMIDFPGVKNEFQNGILGDYTETHERNTLPGLLSTDLVNGYPTATATGTSLSQMFSDASDANHLFISSTYEATGYFEFDSCQSFATLIQEDGSVGTDFRVFRELGTAEGNKSNTMKHGQFFPYDIITPGVTSNDNQYNLYSALADRKNAETGALPNTDPRKYEKLLTVGSSPNYYNGMELSARFVQTPDGKDDWGHDIIFEFTGDDDFWLYVDDELVLDLGGIHSALGGSVNFATGDVIENNRHTNLREIFESNYRARNPQASQTDVDDFLAEYFNPGENKFKNYSAHTMNIFYMERGAGASNLHLKFNLTSVTPGSVMLSKEVSGSDDLDFSLVQFPYQIYYRQRIDGQLVVKQLTNDNGEINVTSQSPTKNVEYYPSFTPPNSNVSYDHVYFLSPSQGVEIHFPDKTIDYKIVECGVNPEVYSSVSVNNGTPITGVLPDPTGKRKDFTFGWANVEDTPVVIYDNHVSSEGLRTLSFRKKLYDANDNLLTAEDDHTVFTFRLYLSSMVDTTPQLAYMAKYRVKSPSGYYCSWNPDVKDFEPTGITNVEGITEDQKNSITFDSSINGSISNIPVGYTVEVPNLPVSTKFIVEERGYEIPQGYEIIGYDRESGSYYNTGEGDTLNSGTVRANESPSMTIKNRRGWGIDVNKVWSDADFTSSHEAIYIAVYVNGTLLPGTIKQIASPGTTASYFFSTLETGADFSDYNIREVNLTDPVVDPDGNVISYTDLVLVDEGQSQSLSAVASHTGNTSEWSYAAHYEQGEPVDTSGVNPESGNIRTDTVTNTREDGVVLTLYDMVTRQPLAGGSFTLKQGNTEIGTYTSGSDGRITILYEFDRDQNYTLTQEIAPRGYIGLPNAVTFSIDNDNNVTIGGNEEKWQQGYNPESQTDKIIAYIDVFNKPFQLMVLKYNSSTNEPLPGAHFALYRSVKGYGNTYIKDYVPMNGFADIVSEDDGVLYGIDNTLAPGTYYLTETAPPEGFQPLDEDISFTISDLGEITMETLQHSSYLRRTETDDNYVYTLSIPNETGSSEYFFDIEKVIFVDKNIHSSDQEQKFIFKVERFAEDQQQLTAQNVLETFYVTLNCDEEMDLTDPEDIQIGGEDYNYWLYTDPDDQAYPKSEFENGSSGVKIKKTYQKGTDTEVYKYPAAVWNGRKTVKVTEKGIYRVTEVASWSSGDYDLWKGSNVYKGFSENDKSAGGITDGGADGSVIFSVDKVRADQFPEETDHITVGEKDYYRPTASFTNSETEFAYLSSQSYAENTIKLQ